MNRVRVAAAGVLIAAAATGVSAAPASGSTILAGSWSQLVSWCHQDARHAVCDALPGDVRADYGLGARPARMICPSGDTVYIVADYHGHVRVVDKS